MECHPDEDQLERYSIDIMEARQAAAFEEHLLICDTCQDRLLDMETFVEAMRRAALVCRREQSSPKLVAVAHAGSS